MTLDDALSGVTRLALDSAPRIYFVEQHPVHLPIMREVIQRIDGGELAGCGCVILLTEVLNVPSKRQDAALERLYHQVLTGSRKFNLLPVGQQAADYAATLRARHNLRTPDALIAATALEEGCEALLTNDHRMGRVTGLRVLLLDELTL
jgi:predicted nucleic acid-binding protein